MTGNFAETLSGILDQKSELESSNEKAVEMFVVLPVLTQLGWNTSNLAEVFPQQTLEDKSKTDFELRIDGESKIVIEVKTWGNALNNGERQLEGYCRLAKPKLAVLTNGLKWKFYLPPKSTRGHLREFLDLDINSHEPVQIEDCFRQFLSRDSMADCKATIKRGTQLFKERENYKKFEGELTNALDELPGDAKAMEAVVIALAGEKSIQATENNIRHFLDKMSDKLIIEVIKPSHQNKKPAKFYLPTSPTGKNKKERTVSKPKGWNNFLLDICILMEERHPDNFHPGILSMTHRFSESNNTKFSEPTDFEGIYACKAIKAQEIRKDCFDILAKFGYPEDSMVILDINGDTL